MAYQKNDELVKKHADRRDKFTEIYEELISDPVKFVEKYSKKTSNKKLIHRLLKDNPDIFKSKSIYSKFD